MIVVNLGLLRKAPTKSKENSMTLYKENYTVIVPPRSLIHHIATNNFSISPAYRQYFRPYHLLYWQAKYLLEQVREGAINLESGSFIVIYHRCTRGQLLANPDSQVAISFRAPAQQFNVPAYALVSLI